MYSARQAAINAHQGEVDEIMSGLDIPQVEVNTSSV